MPLARVEEIYDAYEYVISCSSKNAPNKASFSESSFEMNIWNVFNNDWKKLST